MAVERCLPCRLMPRRAGGGRECQAVSPCPERGDTPCWPRGPLRAVRHSPAAGRREGRATPAPLCSTRTSALSSARGDSLVSLWEQLRGSKASVLGWAECSEAHRQHKLPLFIVPKFLYPRQCPDSVQDGAGQLFQGTPRGLQWPGGSGGVPWGPRGLGTAFQGNSQWKVAIRKCDAFERPVWFPAGGFHAPWHTRPLV